MSVHNGHTDNCGADIPQFQLVALLVGRLAALAPLLAQQQILEYHSEDTPGDARFRSGLPDQSPCGFFPDVLVGHPACAWELVYLSVAAM